MQLNTNPIIAAIRARQALETAVDEVSAPLKAALADALGDLPAALKSAKAAEESARADFEAEFLAATNERRAAMLSGAETAPIATPGLSVRWTASYVITGPVDPAFLTPDDRAIKAAIKSGVTPSGVTVVQIPSFAVVK